MSIPAAKSKDPLDPLSPQRRESLGFIGLGQMGGAMVRRCLAQGIRVTVFDLSAVAMVQATADGAIAASSARDVADREEVVVACLPSQTACRQAAIGVDGAIHGARIKVYVETSTVGITVVRELAQALSAAGIALVDAPVSGGPRGADAGTLFSMVGAKSGAWNLVHDLVAAYSAQSIIVGEEPGLGQACKLVNNAISMAALAVTCETTVVGIKAGLDLKTMIAAINRSSGRSEVTEKKFPVSVIPRTFDYGASMDTASKDTELFVQEAAALGVPAELSFAVASVWKNAAAHGQSRDFTELFQDFEQRAGL